MIDPIKVIDAFDGEHKFLSNFFPAKVILDGVIYPTVEHAFQAAKTLDNARRITIAAMHSPGTAKKLAGLMPIRSDWEKIKVETMEILLRKKFNQHEFKNLLLSTGNAQLIDGNWGNDTFWGACKGEGQNVLGKLLMKIRQELKD